MKWIGQHVWDFISRFRNDVYLEDVTESTQDHVVGIDADGKLYKQDVSTGDMTGVDISVGTGLDISQSNTTGGNYTSTINLDLTEVINTDGANRILTSDGNGNITAEPNFLFDGNFLSLTAFTSTLTNSVSSNIVVENTGNNVAGGTLDFKNVRVAGVDGDKAGQVRFFANNASGTQKQVGELLSAIPETAAGSEFGNVNFETLNSNGNLRTGLSITGVAGGNDKVNVTLGYDSTSDTTISGNAIVTGDLTVSGTTTTINTTNLNVEDKNIILNYHATNDTSASADGAGITVQDAVNATTDASITWVAAGDNWNTTSPFFAKAIGANRDEIYMNITGSGGGGGLTLRSTSSGGNKTISFPNNTGTVALTSDIPTVPRSIMAAAQPNTVLIYLYKGLTWQGANGSFQLDYGTGSVPNTGDTGATLAQQVLVPIVHAISDMTVYKVTMNWYWTTKYGSVQGSRNFEFSFHSATALNNNQTEQTLSSQIVTTNNNGAFTNDYQYITTWDFASGNGYSMSAGDNLNMFARMNFGSSSTTITSPMIGQIWIEYKYN